MSARRVLAACAATALAVSAPWACRQPADIVDEPDGSPIDPDPELDAGEIPILDSGLGGDAFPECSTRPFGTCVGSNDFPCAFTTWLAATAQQCQLETGCKTNGWLEARMDAEGCVVEIGMDQPNPEIVGCLLAELGSIRCICGEGEIAHFFGSANVGVCTECNAAEKPCPAGEVCVEGVCQATDGGGGG